SRARATSGDGVTPDHPGGDGIPAPLFVVWGVWGANARAVARDDAHGEFWPASAGDGGIFDRTDRGESAGSARHLRNVVSDGRERRRGWCTGTGSECRVSRAGGGGANVRATPAGTQCR